MPEPTDRVLRRLLKSAQLMVPDDLADTVRDHARRLGAVDATLFLVDHDQRVLVALPGATPSEDAVVTIEGSLAGRCFRAVEIHESAAAGQRHVWVPIVDGIERLGVLQCIFPSDGDRPSDADLDAFASMTAELIVSKNSYGDLFRVVRRREPMTLAAEIAWNLLPPLTFGSDRVTISAVLAPAYRVGGDVFDYGVNRNLAQFAIFDAMGHGLEAGLLATVAIAAYRNSRRAGAGLADTLTAIDAAIATTFGTERFVTGVVGELGLDTGRLRWSLSGHPAPLLLRRGRIVKTLDADTGLPFGLGAPGVVVEEGLEPGDCVLLFSDGVVEARSPDGELFGVQRLGDFVAREAAAQHTVPETMRRVMHALLDHQGVELHDDATTVLVEWRGGAAGRAVPIG